jgi:hypothetical protein
MSEQEKKLQRMYGKLPTGRDLLGHKLKVHFIATSSKKQQENAGMDSTGAGGGYDTLVSRRA